INSKMYETVYNEARSDELTGLLNRKYFYEALNNEYEKLGERQLSLILVSVDDVRLYNQLYGNKEGDIVLINVARIMDDY
ncbi:diguanylate cyclase, partial [Bacillus safensis]